MTTKREVPFSGDTFAWVHSELSELKSKLAMVHQAAEQSRSISTDAAESAHQLRTRIEQFDGQDIAISHIQDDMRSMREQLARAQEDINSLRTTREEMERRIQAESERARQDKNEAGRRFGELERHVEAAYDRYSSVEEHTRRNLEAISQLAMRVEAAEGGRTEFATMQSRALAAISRIDQEIQRLGASLVALQREDDVQRERSTSALEVLRRLETEVEAVRAETNRISRLDDRLELVQAERTRHNERLIEVSAELNKVDGRLNTLDERAALIEARIVNYQDELRGLRERLRDDRERIQQYLHGLNDLATDLRKRQIVGIEKEIRDIRGRALDFAEE
jgi:chromosome segregation ATPase